MPLNWVIFLFLLPMCRTDCGCQTNRENKEQSSSAGKYSAPANMDSSHLRTNQMVNIPGGTYEIGTDKPVFAADGEGPKRKISLPEFYLDKYEVSNAEFSLFVDATGHKTEAETFGDSFVFDGLLSETVRSTLTQAVAAAPWWLPVKGADWRHPEGFDSNIDGNMHSSRVVCITHLVSRSSHSSRCSRVMERRSCLL